MFPAHVSTSSTSRHAQTSDSSSCICPLSCQFFLSLDEKRLYYKPNASSDFDASTAEFVAPALKTVIEVRGTQQEPVSDFS